MDWLAIELLNGLTKLLSLGLDRTPASDVIEMTVGTWHEGLTHGRSWSEARDTPRIRHAFATLFNTCDRWPQPKHLVDALPRVEDSMPRLAHEFKPASPEVVAKARAELEQFLKDPAPVVEPKPEREGPPLSAVEAELHAHYASTGKMAAAGPDA